jgi:hypothetical protein
VQDIAKDGCGKLFVSIEACPIEYDLTAIVDGTLRLGDRSHPLCTPDARPVKLQAFGFRKATPAGQRTGVASLGSAQFFGQTVLQPTNRCKLSLPWSKT